MNILEEKGYMEIKPNLWKKLCGTHLVFHDFRNGYRWSYAFTDGGSFDVKTCKEYKMIKQLEESKKCKTLDKF